MAETRIKSSSLPEDFSDIPLDFNEVKKDLEKNPQNFIEKTRKGQAYFEKERKRMVKTSHNKNKIVTSQKAKPLVDGRMNKTEHIEKPSLGQTTVSSYEYAWRLPSGDEIFFFDEEIEAIEREEANQSRIKNQITEEEEKEYEKEDKGERRASSYVLLPPPRPHLPIRKVPVSPSVALKRSIPQDSPPSRDCKNLYVVLELLRYVLSCTILSVVIIAALCNVLDAIIIASGVGFGLVAGLGLFYYRNPSLEFFPSNREQSQSVRAQSFFDPCFRS